MAHVEVHDELYERLQHFKQVVETVVGEKMSVDGCAAILLTRGVHAMMEDIIGTLDPAILQDFVQQLGGRFSAQVYASVAENLTRERAMLNENGSVVG